MNHIKEISKELILSKFPWIHEVAFDICGQSFIERFIHSNTDESIDFYFREIGSQMMSAQTRNVEERNEKLKLVLMILYKIKVFQSSFEWELEEEIIANYKCTLLRWNNKKMYLLYMEK